MIEFDEEAPAIEFERYLKTGSGREFARRHFRQGARSCGRYSQRNATVGSTPAARRAGR